MSVLLLRLFLLFLLGVDWVGDPYFGRSPLSRPFGSQECCCRSLTDANLVAGCVSKAASEQIGLLPLVLAVNESIAPVSMAVEHSSFFSGQDCLYIFMSLRR